MFCKFCKLSTQHVELATTRFYCNEECRDFYHTYSECKLSMNKNEAVPQKQEKESFHEIVLRTNGYPVHGAHRGGGFDFGPENTLYSFKRSVEYGVRLLELDLRLTKDNVLVLLHWSTIDETTNGSGSVSDYTLAELRQFDAGFRHPTLKGTGICIPTFKEFLDEFVPVVDLLFFFDFKDPLTLRMALKFIEPYKIEGRFILGSVMSNTNTMIRNLTLATKIPVCSDIHASIKVLVAYHLGLLDYCTLEHDIYGFVLCKATLPFWCKGFVDALHERNRRVVISGYGEELCKRERLGECLQYGVDFIMVDRPDLMSEIMKQH